MSSCIRALLHIAVSIVIFVLHSDEVSLNGYYTSNLKKYNLVVPHKLTKRGEFLTFHIPQFFKHNFFRSRKKRSLDDDEAVNYGIRFLNKNYHVTLWPNHDFVSPDAVTESRRPNEKIRKRDINKVNTEKLCHFSGIVRNIPDSRVAFSTCDGLAGFMTIGDKMLFIEPLKDHRANKYGHHLHLVYEEEDKIRGKKKCGTTNDWKRSWKENLKRRALRNFRSRNRRRDTKSLDDVDRYLELLIVCDKKFVNFHKRIHEIENYILTVINMVSELFRDPSIGFDIDLQVVRIIYLEKEQEEVDLAISNHANNTLESFCNWQKKINPLDIKNPNHHDIAVLVTRHDICEGNSSSDCGIMGLSYIGAPCIEEKSCVISEDTGLILGYVMTHELGHVMGCAHDDPEESGCKAKDKDGSYFIMSPVVHVHTLRWSPCSRAFIEDLFENELGECLFDKPEVSLYKQTNILPGVIYDGQAQCEMSFPGSRLETTNEETFCEQLFCRVNGSLCVSTGETVVDGTKCGENKWCFQTKCIEAGQRPKAVNGGWSEWSPPTTCSRTCGGGVTMSERQCNNPIPANGGRYCIGESQKFWICNTEPCPPGDPTFRDVQCAEGNTKSSEGPWRAYFKDDEPCVLFCMNDEGIIRKIHPRAKDGTPCKPGTQDTCISGKCTKVGCDFLIGSDAVDDICGICNGDGTECEIIENFYNHTGQDYEEVALIPAESRNIMFEELGTSPNIIAVKDTKSNRFLLNGDHKESPDITMSIDGHEALYRHPEPDRELLVIKGPLATHKLLYVCFFKPFTVGYKYRYARMITDTRRIGMYHWEVLEYEKCSANCEGGIQEPIIGCVEEKQGKVSPRYCKHIKRITTEARKCNEHPCRTRWRIGKWGKCHACAFQSGVRTRHVECVKESPHPGAEENLVDDNECSGPIPASKELCNAVKVCRCRRRTTLGIPNRQLRDVWRQLKKLNAIKKKVRRQDDIDSLREMEAKILNCEEIPEDLETLTEKSEKDSKCSQSIAHEKSSTTQCSKTHPKEEHVQQENKTGITGTVEEKKVEDECNNDNIEKNISSPSPDICEEKETRPKCPSNSSHVKIKNKKLFNNKKNKICKVTTVKPICDEFHFTPYESVDSNGKVVKVNVGDLYVDKKNNVESKIIEVPFKETSLTMNSSDSAFQQLGDEFGDEILVDEAKTLSGQEAKKETNKIRRKLGHVSNQP
ncbi:A disintegrin and metalloproteinase with thrombospondin motifs 12-like [Coccinella septempunctata]|uniref:A disintegrin and metalloproteinase with thrombospondin motifs 12-like n=1 Tax=Coccinella septempunctata TaxID=41139 RepID=UPI001D090AC1|nr:A disintegrin and metalloproteinase with thrombospondin motifs 12-like [Coccinella septempunctata]